MYQIHEHFKSTIARQPKRLQAIELADEEDVFNLHACGGPETWLSRRLSYDDYVSREASETLPETQDNAVEILRWNSVFGMDVSACMMRKNPVCVDVPAADWSWCADPL